MNVVPLLNGPTCTYTFDTDVIEADPPFSPGTG
jgi:hypothetical protein